MSRNLLLAFIMLAVMTTLGVYYMAGGPPAQRPAKERAAPTKPQPLTQLPEFTLPDLAGTPQLSSRWDGKVLVLNFWATWCPPCRKEMPGFMALQEELGEQGLQFVGIAIDSPESVRKFAAEREINYPILIGDESAIQISKQLGNRFQGLPFSAIFDRKGSVVYVQGGELKPEIIREKISALL